VGVRASRPLFSERIPVSAIVHKRVLGEAVHALIKNSSPTLHDLGNVADSLARVMTDVIGAECRVVIRVDARALQIAIDKAEAEERGAA
jgi:hypothetical protein